MNVNGLEGTGKPTARQASSGRTFDWEGARRRIAEAMGALEAASEITPEMLEQIWAQRAASLAQAPLEEDAGELIELVLIRLGQEVYGLDVRHVFEIRPVEKITPVPRVPNWVKGVVNLRGRVLSVMDMRRFLNLPQAENRGENDVGVEERTPCLIVVETPDLEVVLLADDVLTVDALPTDRIRDASSTVRGISKEYVRGVVEYEWDESFSGGGTSVMVVVLDLLALLSDERLIVHEEIV